MKSSNLMTIRQGTEKMLGMMTSSESKLSMAMNLSKVKCLATLTAMQRMRMMLVSSHQSCHKWRLMKKQWVATVM